MDANVDKKDFVIDEDEIGLEWIRQTGLVYKYTQIAAELRLRWEEAKRLSELTRAEVELDVRKNSKSYKLDKVTEDTVKAAVVADDRYQKSLRRIIQTKHELDLAEGAVRSMEHKRTALSNLTEMHKTHYYSNVEDNDLSPPLSSKELPRGVNRRNRG